MKTATQNLELDHKYILQLIDVMDVMVSQKAINTNDIETVISLIRNFADGFHHAKEENLLFPLMEEKGFSREQGPIAVMLYDHHLGRTYVKGMDENLQHYKKGDKGSIDAVHENMNGYSSLLKNHISKENNVLFRMADKAFTDDDQKYLIENFEQIENSESYAGKISEYINAIEHLKMLYKSNYQLTY